MKCCTSCHFTPASVLWSEVCLRQCGQKHLSFGLNEVEPTKFVICKKKTKTEKQEAPDRRPRPCLLCVISVSKIIFHLKLSGIIHYQGSSLDVQNVWVTFRGNIPEYSVHIASYCIHYARFWEQKLGSYLVFSKFDTAHLPECKFVCGFSIPLISLFFPPCQSKIPISIWSWATRHDLNCGLWLTETQVYFKTVVNQLNLICLKKLHPQLSFVIACPFVKQSKPLYTENNTASVVSSRYQFTKFSLVLFPNTLRILALVDCMPLPVRKYIFFLHFCNLFYRH